MTLKLPGSVNGKTAHYVFIVEKELLLKPQWVYTRKRKTEQKNSGRYSIKLLTWASWLH